MEEPLGRQLVFTAKAMREAFEDTLTEAGGSLATWVVLSGISNEVGFINQSVLASRVRLEGATITHHVDRLEQHGLVRRVADPNDRRVRRLELTAEGIALQAKLFKAARDFETKAFAGLSAKALSELGKVLARIGANLERD
jgi:MarR family transcriptional regulator, transcriptional regulator for hemolysin